jgi:hypothetical protein
MSKPGREESVDLLARSLATSYEFEQLLDVFESNAQCLRAAHQSQVRQSVLMYTR